ncbi:fimbrillin family protein [Alistipes sp.]|uniref:fimbrillin family protein n=1 Tax=Alistipes sp. TaxID=1872444 RepID=UPI0025BCBC3E|nr:fimbrillin family protein [Alistipes sp.]
MRNKFFYMATCVALALTAAGCSDDEEKDIPVIGDISVSGIYNVYSHGNQGWIQEDKVGLYVLSDGKAQDNLPYVSTKVAGYKEVEMGGKTYILYNEKIVEDTPLKPASDIKAGFKAGEHWIYAYVPFSEASKDHTAVALPDVSVQQYYAAEFMPHRKYGFDVAAAKVSAYSAAVVSLGEFKPLFSQITLPSVACPETLVGKKLTKVVVTCDRPLSYEPGATINLATMEIAGKGLNTVTYEIPDGLEVKANKRGGASLETCYVMIAVPFETALNCTFKFDLTIDGRVYTINGQPDARKSSRNNLNMHGIEGIK